MIKKTILFLTLAMIVMGGASAQDSVFNTSFDFKSGPTPHKGALFVDLGYTFYYLGKGGFGIGLGWEGRINDASTYLISGNIGAYGHDYGWWGGKYSGFDFGLEGNYRYYFLKSALDKVFVNVGLGFGITTWTWSGSFFKDDTYSWSALYIPLYAGYKLILGPGFVVEVELGYRIGIGVSKPGGYNSTWAPTFGGGIYGIALGWAFK